VLRPVHEAGLAARIRPGIARHAEQPLNRSWKSVPVRNDLWLLGALIATVFYQFALNSGLMEITIWLVLIFFLLQLLRGRCSPRELPVPGYVLLLLIALLLLLSWTCAFEMTDTHRSIRLVKCLIIAIGVWCLDRSQTGRMLEPALAGLCSLVVFWHFIALYGLGSPDGAFDNPHYLSYFSALLIPLLLLLISRMQRSWRYLLLTVLLLDLSLVANNFSKPALPLLSLGGALLLCLLLTLNGWKRWTLTASFLVLATILLMQTRVTAFILEDERMQIWADSLRMSFSSPWMSRITGHGLGSFANDFSGVSVATYAYLSIPHNHLLQALYENGIFGSALMLLALSGMLLHSIRLYARTASSGLRRTSLANLAAFIIWFAFSNLAFGLYSTYTLYPLGFIIGVYLALAGRAARPMARSPS